MAKAIFERSINCSRKDEPENADGLRIIGAGLPRTGTSSLHAALEILGFGPCHHMTELIKKPERSVQFLQALHGSKVDFYSLMKGYGSAVDTPTNEFYKEIHEAYPKAKIILTVRDSGEKWFESWKTTIRIPFQDNLFYLTVYPYRFLRLQIRVCRKISDKWTAEFGQIGPQLHDKYNARVISETNRDDLLVFNVKEGWKPLCKFLGVNVPPDIPFPNVNDTKEFHRRLATARKLGWYAWAVIGLIISIAAYFMFRVII